MVRAPGRSTGRSNRPVLRRDMTAHEDLFFERTIGGLAGNLHDLAVPIVEPAVISATNTATLDVAKAKVRAPVRAICADHSRPPRSISEENEILSEDANESRLCFQMRRDTDGPPVATQKFAHRCASPGASENLIFFSSRLVHEYLGGSEPQRDKGHIINFGLFGPVKGDRPVAPTMIFLLLCPPRLPWLKSYLQFANTFFIVRPRPAVGRQPFSRSLPALGR